MEKTLMLGKTEGGGLVTVDEMAGWYHRLKRQESEQIPTDREIQGSLGVRQSMGPQRVGHD